MTKKPGKRIPISKHIQYKQEKIIVGRKQGGQVDEAQISPT